MEIWKQIKNFSKYEASTEGNIRNKETQKILSQKSLDKDGYMWKTIITRFWR